VRQAKLQPVEREGGSARPVASVAGSSATAKRTQRDDEDCIELRKILTAEAEALRTAAGNMCGTVLRGLHRSPVRAVKDRVGTWETSGRPQPPRRSRVSSGRRGAEAGPEGRRRRTAAWLHSTDECSGAQRQENGVLPWFLDHQAARTDSGRSSIRLRTVTAIRVSTSWVSRVCERKVSPMMRLYRLIAPSAPALAL
jgi:hypothetical protein